MTGTEWLAPTVAALLASIFGATAGWTRRTSPPLATRVMLSMSAIVATAMFATLVMLALPLVGQSDLLADRANWSEAVFARGSTSGRVLSVFAAFAVAIVGLRVLLEWRSQSRAKTAACRFRDDVGAAHGATVVAAAESPDALALSSGVIVVTRGLIRALDGDERRAVLAHEHAHLNHRHHRYVQAAALLAAVNPLLRQLPDAIAFLTERWADEDAAIATSRDTTARALERVAHLTSSRHQPSTAALCAASVAVEQRIVALRSEPPRKRWAQLVSPLVLVALIVALALITTEQTLDVFQLAGAFRDVAVNH